VPPAIQQIGLRRRPLSERPPPETYLLLLWKAKRDGRRETIPRIPEQVRHAFI